MNSNQFPQPADQPAPTNLPQLGTTPLPEPPHRRTGKVARLPKATRDKINLMLQDGLTYLQIIERLGPEAQGLTEKNLSNWRSGGYLDSLRAGQLTDALQTKYELAQDIIANATDSTAPGRAILHILATNICEFLADTDPAALRESLLSDADKFTRFANAMVRLAEGGIKCQVHQFRAEDRADEAAKRKTPAERPGISEESLHTAEEKLNLL